MSARRTGRIAIGLATALLMASGAGAAETVYGRGGSGPGVRFDFNPLAALHSYLRAEAEAAAESGTPGVNASTGDPMGQAIEAYRAFAAAAPPAPDGARHLLRADVLVASLDDLDDLRTRLINPASGPAGERLSGEAFRATLLPALEQAWPIYAAGQAARDKKEVRDRIAWWTSEIAPRLQPALSWLSGVVGLPTFDELDSDTGSVGVRLVPVMPGKGAATFRTRQGVSIVAGTRRYQGSAFVEVILHEMLHAWEVAYPDSLTGTLRRRLEAANADTEPRRQVPHVLIFLLAAEATTRFIDKEHVSMGEQYGAYTRGLERYRGTVEPLLREHLASRLARGALIDRLVAAFAPAAPAVPAVPAAAGTP